MSGATRRRLEVCVDDATGLAAAVAGGADRIELCGALALGGLTPSPGLIALGGDIEIPVHVMIRARAGGFEADSATLDTMRRDIDAVRAAGLAGVVFGASRPSGALDVRALQILADHADGLDRTLHRAFDIAPDLAEALESAVALGFDRILSSGGATSAPEGIASLAALVAQAGERIAVMPGGGVTAATVAEIVRDTGALEIHASCSVATQSPRRLHALGFSLAEARVTSQAAVVALVRTLRALDA